MYERHFGLMRKPFEIASDPAFYYESEPLRETLAALIYGVQERRGVLSLVGAAGTGKSTLLTRLVRCLDTATTKVVISHSTLDRDEFLDLLCQELDAARDIRPGRIDASGRGVPRERVDRILYLKRWVESEGRNGRTVPVVIVDEAQNLSEEVLEEIRLLSNLQLPRGPLLQIVLAGQPLLGAKLESTALTALRQRIAVPLRLLPFDAEQSRAYIAWRLRAAGASPREIFTPRAADAIIAASGGIPRVINTLCEWCLVNAFGMGQERIDERLATESTRDLELPPNALPFLGAPSLPLVASSPRPLPKPRGGPNRSSRATPLVRKRMTPRPAYGVLVGTYRVYSKARMHAGKLSRAGHDATVIRSLLSDGTQVSQVMVGVSAYVEHVRETAERLANDGIEPVEVRKLSGWDASVTRLGAGRIA